ncbi:iron-containing alcohol dehydrogenase [Nibricoccus sp. IMCC34717]|uniref:iron-containing alcohol dehydrogenase n=1 Tax=Nibricoccus sp. IMCC34717 TaxID=3034021 RepID=UPI0038505DE3
MALEVQAVPPVEAGPGAGANAVARALSFGTRVLVVRGASDRHSAKLYREFSARGVLAGEFVVPTEPTVELALACVEMLRASAADVLVAIGGGSVIDTAKAAAGLAANPGDPFDYLEVVGRAQPLRSASLPWIALPTTAGTGAEATRNAVLGASAAGTQTGASARVKVSLRSPHLLARLVILDPDFLRGMPPEIRVATAMDALTQLLEAFVCTRANPQSDLFCEGGLRRLAWALPRWIAGDEAPEVREALSWSAFWSGVALAQSGLGAVHGIAGPLGGAFPVAHGAACAALLTPVFEANTRRLLALGETHPGTQRMHRAAQLVLQSPDARAGDLVACLRQFTRMAGVKRLAELGVPASAHADLAKRALAASSMKANPVALSEEELVGILRSA